MSDAKRVLRINVTEDGRAKATVRIPLALAKLAGIGGIADKITAEHGIDVREILRRIDEMPDEKIVDVVDEEKGAHVEIFVESTVAVGA